MSYRNWPWLPFLALVGWLGIKIAMLAAQLPQNVAVHFDSNGNANGWSSKEALIGSIGVLAAIFLVVFLFAGFMDRMPDRMVNLPRKDHWLAPARRTQTYDFLIGWMRWFLVAVFAFIAWLFSAVLELNLVSATRPRLDMPAWALPAMIIFIVAMFARLLLAAAATLNREPQLMQRQRHRPYRQGAKRWRRQRISGAGSKPWLPHGWQRQMRESASQLPRHAPFSSMASSA